MRKKEIGCVLRNQLEAEIAELDYEEGIEFLEDMGLEEPGLNKLIRESYKMPADNLFTEEKRK